MQPRNLIDAVTQNRNYLNHRRKIENIMNKQIVPNVDVKRKTVLDSVNQFKQKANRHSVKGLYIEFQNTMQKDNALIYQKILKVNNRKNQTLMPINPMRSFSHNNLNNLKRNIVAINSENEHLAKKLISTKSSLSQDKLCSNYRKHLEVRERLIKYDFDENLGQIVPKHFKTVQKIQKFHSKTLNGSRFNEYRQSPNNSSRLNTLRRFPQNQEGDVF